MSNLLLAVGLGVAALSGLKKNKYRNVGGECKTMQPKQHYSFYSDYHKGYLKLKC